MLEIRKRKKKKLNDISLLTFVSAIESNCQGRIYGVERKVPYGTAFMVEDVRLKQLDFKLGFRRVASRVANSKQALVKQWSSTYLLWKDELSTSKSSLLTSTT